MFLTKNRVYHTINWLSGCQLGVASVQEVQAKAGLGGVGCWLLEHFPPAKTQLKKEKWCRKTPSENSEKSSQRAAPAAANFSPAMHKMHNFFTLRRPNVLKQALLCCAYHGMRAKGDLEVF